MASFDKYSNYNENAGVSSVVFGAEKPVLEVELNEMQEVQKSLLRKTIKNLLGDGITDKKAISYSNGVVTIASDVCFVVDGLLIKSTGMSIEVPYGNTVYLQVWEETVDSTTTLKKEGNQLSSETVDNYILDSRTPAETTRRKVVKYTLSLTTDSTKHNLAICNVSNTGYFTRANIKEVNLAKLSDRVNDLQTYIGDYDGVFGVEVDLEGNTVKRVGNNMYSTPGSDYDNYPIYGGRKRCNVTDDGHIIAYYGDDYYTETGALTVEAIGSNGVTYPVGTKVQCMVYQPKFYYKRVPLRLYPNVDSSYNVTGFHLLKWLDLISTNPRDGYKLHPAFMRGDEELEYYLIGENDGCIEDASGVYDLTDSTTLPSSPYTGYKFSSIADAKPASGAVNVLTRDAVRKLCANRGTGWQQLDITILSAEQMLFLIEYATFNIQATTIAPGITSLPTSATANDSVPNPTNTTLGNGSGVIKSSYTASDGVTYDVTTPVFRGVKNPYGNIWKYVDGIIRNYSADTNNVVSWQDGSSDFSDTPANYIDEDFSFSIYSGFPRAFGHSEDDSFMYIPSLIGGTSVNPIGDYYYSQLDTAIYCAIMGGHWSEKEYCGLFCLSTNNSIYASSRIMGGRLCRKPSV